MDFPINTFPSNTVTDGEYLYRGLGSFWTQLFSERDTLKGYTRASAEELVQRYYELIEVIDSYSVESCPIFKKEKWRPIVLYKSKFNKLPFSFKQNDAVFGPQPESSVYYQDLTFQFGRSKTPAAAVYSYQVGKELASFSVIADKVIAPQKLYIQGSDVYRDASGALYFNSNIFEDSTLPRALVIGENGEVETYTDNEGNEFEEEFLVLWAYHGSQDVDFLYYNFGHIFNFKQVSSATYRSILSALFALYVDGPTIRNIQACCAAFLDIPYVYTPVETVDYIFADTSNNYVVTDKNCYKLKKEFTLRSDLANGKILYVGDLLIEDVAVYDNLKATSLDFYAPGQQTYGWWTKPGVLGTKLALSKHLFYGKYFHQLLFSTELDVISLNAVGDIVFPVTGDTRDVDTFNRYLNSNSSRKTAIKEALGLENPGDTYVTIPVNFVLENFMKSNCAMIYVAFYDEDIRTRFLNLLPLLREQFPPYVYLILRFDINQEVDVYTGLNDTITISFDSGDEVLNADGSNSTGEIENLSPFGYKDVNNRLFEIAYGVRQSSTADLPMDYVVTDEDVLDVDTVSDGRFLLVKDGTPLRPIPTGATTAQYNNLLLIAF